MLKRLQEQIGEAIGKIRWFARFLAERVRVDMALFKLMYQSEKMEKQRDSLIRRIGERVVDCRATPEKNIFKDTVVAEALAELEAIDREIDEVRQKASEIGRSTKE